MELTWVVMVHDEAKTGEFNYRTSVMYSVVNSGNYPAQLRRLCRERHCFLEVNPRIVPQLRAWGLTGMNAPVYTHIDTRPWKISLQYRGD
jgi:hypothetical protein